MKQRNLGKSGLRVSIVGLGGNNFGGRIESLEQSRKVVHKALDLGINLIDTADVYGKAFGASEECLGQILGERRKEVVLATKFGMGSSRGEPHGASRRYLMSALEASLRRLNTDWIDLYQLHTPDPRTPIEETLRALDDMVRQGKIRYFGCSNLAAWSVVDAQWTSRLLGINGFICCQDEYSLLVRGIERELIPAIQALGLGLLPYFPLASGLLTGKYKRNAAMPEHARLSYTEKLANQFLTDANWALAEKLETFCAERGHSPIELAFSWLARQPTVSSIIAGATAPEQLEQNVRAVDWELSPEDLAQVDRLTRRQ